MNKWQHKYVPCKNCFQSYQLQVQNSKSFPKIVIHHDLPLTLSAMTTEPVIVGRGTHSLAQNQNENQTLPIPGATHFARIK